MGLLSRFRAEKRPPLSPGVAVEPLDPEGLRAIVRGLSESTDARVDYQGNGWTIWPFGTVEDPDETDRCVTVNNALLSRTREEIHAASYDRAEAVRQWRHVVDVNLVPVRLLALAVGIATDPDEVDRIAG